MSPEEVAELEPTFAAFVARAHAEARRLAPELDEAGGLIRDIFMAGVDFACHDPALRDPGVLNLVEHLWPREDAP